MVYLAVGLLVLLLWLVKGTASTDLIGAFALSLLGWLIGAAGVVFQTEKPGANLRTATARQSNQGSSPCSGKTSLRVAITVRSTASLGSKPTSQDRHQSSTSSPISSGAA